MKIRLFQPQRIHILSMLSILVAQAVVCSQGTNTQIPTQQGKTAHSHVVLSPEQLDASLHLDKNDLALDTLLEEGPQTLNMEIDSVAATNQTTQNKATQQPPQKRPAIPPIKSSRPKITFANTSPEERIEFQFEDADLQNLLTQVSDLYDVSFVTDDSISPITKNGKAIKGNKISFKTNKPLTRQQAWDLFLSFLDIAELSIVPEADPHILRITTTTNAKTSPLPTYIGVRSESLPDNDQFIRYLYFIENTSLDTINTIVGSLKSPAAGLVILKDLNAFVLTDKSSNIRSLMNIITELDKVNLPQSMSVLKLRRANAEDVKKLYDTITQADDTSITARLFPARKQPSALYFPENTRIIAEPRTNSLVLLGPLEAIKKIEEFIYKNVDVELGEETLSPLRVYSLKYADAITVADIMNNVAQFGKATPAGKTGGVRDGDKYIRSLVFIAEPATNRLIIKGDEDDWLQAKNMIEKLDEPQPQVAIEALILTVNLNEIKELGAQIRSKRTNGVNGIEGLVGNGVVYQTSGIRLGGSPNTFALNTTTANGVERLLGNLVSLATGAIPGNTLITLGADNFGVWGIFSAFQTITNAQVISNPFLTASNKQQAIVSVGETRRVVSGTVIAGSSAASQTNSFANDSANLTLKVIPQINSDGMIVLDLDVTINEFTNPADPASGTKLTRQVKTNTIVADKEVIALGGLVRNVTDTSMTKVPILGSIPIIGWLFKNKNKTDTKSSLLILISTRILKPGEVQGLSSMTEDRIRDYHATIDEMQEYSDKRDPIHRSFFSDQENTSDKIVDDFIFERHSKLAGNRRGKNPRTARLLRSNKQKQEAALPPPRVTKTAQQQLPPPPQLRAPRPPQIKPAVPKPAPQQPKQQVVQKKKPSLSTFLPEGEKEEIT